MPYISSGLRNLNDNYAVKAVLQKEEEELNRIAGVNDVQIRLELIENEVTFDFDIYATVTSESLGIKLGNTVRLSEQQFYNFRGISLSTWILDELLYLTRGSFLGELNKSIVTLPQASYTDPKTTITFYDRPIIEKSKKSMLADMGVIF